MSSIAEIEEELKRTIVQLTDAMQILSKTINMAVEANIRATRNAGNIDQTAALLFRIMYHLGISVEDALPLVELTAPIEGFEEWMDELRAAAMALMEEDGDVLNPKDFKDFLDTLDGIEEL